MSDRARPDRRTPDRRRAPAIRGAPTSDEVDLVGVLERAYDLVAASRVRHRAGLAVREAGAIEWVGEGVAGVRGLPEVEAEELVRFPSGLLGLAFNLDPDEVGVVLLDDATGLEAGDPVERTGRELDVPVGEALLGRVVDAVGRPLDDAGPLVGVDRRPVHQDVPSIMDRAPVSVPLQTGIKVVDALVPVGRGQRELIIGDRETGKTAIALATMLNQTGNDVVCVYCAIGRRGSAVARVISELRDHGTMDQCIVVVAGGDDAPGLQYVAPYAATTMAESFMERGRDVLIVYDDLTRHARAYRELSLLLRRPPGREAYPGDIFYVHARLLERATQLTEQAGGGSLTALPVVETQAQNLAAYIPTNLISITDGQIYLSPTLFQKGVLPAVDVGRSVSRVGGAAQLPAYRAVTGRLRLSYSQFHELEQFSRFAAHLDEQTRQTLAHGRRIREVLKQPEFTLIPVDEQVAILLAATTGAFDDVPLADMADAEECVRAAVRTQLPATCERIRAGEPLGDTDVEALNDAARIATRPLIGVEQASGEDAAGPLPAPPTDPDAEAAPVAPVGVVDAPPRGPDAPSLGPASGPGDAPIGAPHPPGPAA